MRRVENRGPYAVIMSHNRREAQEKTRRGQPGSMRYDAQPPLRAILAALNRLLADRAEKTELKHGKSERR
jgi:hypothetical protein